MFTIRYVVSVSDNDQVKAAGEKSCECELFEYMYISNLNVLSLYNF